MNTKFLLPLAAVAASVALPSMGLAQDATVATGEPALHTSYILTTLLFLMGGFLVFWMAAGFAMLEAGLVRSKNVTMQLTKNIALFSLAAIMYWLVGFNLMYPGDGWSIGGWLGAFAPTSLEPVGVSPEDTALDYASVGSDFFFQLMFCATTASIVSGTLAERIKLWPFLVFVVVLTGFIYPIEASWQWGGGWLSELGFSDFAGSTLVHAAGGFAALAGAIVLGPRLGKFKDGKTNPMPGSNLALATLGTFILWLGWFGFNGGSQLAMGTVGDVADVSRIFANTNMAAAAGAVAALILTQVLYGKVDLTMVLNGALAGLVSITAEPLAPSLFGALLTGAVGGVIVVFAVPMLDKMKIDDVVGAIPVHLVAGIWGTLAVAFYTGNWGAQIIGIVAIGAFVFVTSLIVWIILKGIMGLRPSEEDEIRGLDVAELGMEAYPDFTKG
ncbi:MAG: ammonium transporter [Rhodobacteraceae bacterium]|uniref:ammonium transporter n=1 Tax=Roseobacteraceae TaxID=2854170 RepID=UPI0019369312|nr:ammonium transporter [Roseovarius sp. 10]MBE1289977.1 ammonium transporter [Paracoccaceae bacterium]MBF9021649.1 ammonium transporter [Rhodobacterales bacterium FZCC0069]MBF9027671.1 ammonium transporter [Rhodobacterales bacterium FZCC0188]QPI84866.1 ammonium transporter [Rhodobacterales bacterium HKCCA1288]MDV7202123.1 ammonium transporter [Roseovarius sp. 10]